MSPITTSLLFGVKGVCVCGGGCGGWLYVCMCRRKMPEVAKDIKLQHLTVFFRYSHTATSANCH